jgi:hypothetical protein
MIQLVVRDSYQEYKTAVLKERAWFFCEIIDNDNQHQNIINMSLMRPTHAGRLIDLLTEKGRRKECGREFVRQLQQRRS